MPIKTQQTQAQLLNRIAEIDQNADGFFHSAISGNDENDEKRQATQDVQQVNNRNRPHIIHHDAVVEIRIRSPQHIPTHILQGHKNKGENKRSPQRLLIPLSIISFIGSFGTSQHPTTARQHERIGNKNERNFDRITTFRDSSIEISSRKSKKNHRQTCQKEVHHNAVWMRG